MGTAQEVGTPPQSDGAGARDASARRVVAASMVGTAIEWYDFFVYGTAAALVFSTLFFPDLDPTTGIIASFATYTVGFVARPVGAIAFGHYGDRLGRKKMLIVSLMMMGVATTLIGLLPTYGSIGIAAPLLLVSLRFVQGLAAGGEWGGAVLMAGEYAPERHRSFFACWPQVGVPVGLMLATGVFTLVSQLPEGAFLSWGWRIPFLLSLALVAFGTYIRVTLVETPEFRRIQQNDDVVKLPLATVLRAQPRNLIAAIGSRIGENIAFIIWTTFVLTYATATLGLDRDTVLIGVMVGAGVSLVTIPLFGLLADRIGPRVVYAGGACLALAYSFPFFWLVDTAEPVAIWLAIAVGFGVAHAAMYAAQAGLFTSLFDARVRYTAISVASTIPAVFAGGFAPILATRWVDQSGGESWPLALYVAVACVITLVSLAAMAVPSPVREPRP